MRFVLTALALLAFAPAAVAAPNVEIRRTSHGIPHIKAGSYEGLGYGYGYAFAQDNLCDIAEAYVTVSAERGATLPAWLRSGRHAALALEDARVLVGAAR